MEQFSGRNYFDSCQCHQYLTSIFSIISIYLFPYKTLNLKIINIFKVLKYNQNVCMMPRVCMIIVFFCVRVYCM